MPRRSILVSSISDSEIVSNPLDFGAVGDGATNDTEAFTAAIAALENTGGVLIVPPGIYMVDSITLTGDAPIQVRGSQGSYLPDTLTKGSIIRCRGAVTNFVSLQGRFRSIHDVLFDGAGLATNVVSLSPTTTGYNFYRVAFIRPVATTGVIVNAPNTGNGEIDHCNFEQCMFHGDPTGVNVAATGFNLYGSNAFMNQFHDCVFYSCTNAVVMAACGASFKTCDFLQIVYACITITDGHDTIRIEDCYTESACVYFIYHSVTTSNGNKPLIVSGNMVNHATPICNFSTGQPITLMANQFTNTCVVDNTARFRPVSIANNWNGTANDYSGAGAQNIDRIGDVVNGVQSSKISESFTIQTTTSGVTSSMNMNHNGNNALITVSGGVLGFGTQTTSAGLFGGGITGYISIVDSGGTPRKLAVVT